MELDGVDGSGRTRNEVIDQVRIRSFLHFLSVIWSSPSWRRCWETQQDHSVDWYSTPGPATSFKRLVTGLRIFASKQRFYRIALAAETPRPSRPSLCISGLYCMLYHCSTYGGLYHPPPIFSSSLMERSSYPFPILIPTGDCGSTGLHACPSNCRSVVQFEVEWSDKFCRSSLLDQRGAVRWVLALFPNACFLTTVD